MITKFVLDAPDTLIRVSYDSGFATDLTSWDIQITESGELTQVIHWNRETESEISTNMRYPYRTIRDVRFIQLSSKAMSPLRKAIEQLDLSGIHELQHGFLCADDENGVSISIPSLEFSSGNATYTINEDCIDDLNEELKPSEAAISDWRSFLKIWVLVDSLAPYSTTEHFKKIQSQRDHTQPQDNKYDYIGYLFLKFVFYFYATIFMLALFLVPAYGFYTLGKTVWYLSYYESDLGEVVDCHWIETDHTSGYAIVVKTRHGVRITSIWYGDQASCMNQIGSKVNVLINPENNQEAVLNTFVDRWGPALSLFVFSGFLIFLHRYFKG